MVVVPGCPETVVFEVELERLVLLEQTRSDTVQDSEVLDADDSAKSGTVVIQWQRVGG
jgi:hypothetical protein